MKGEEFNAAVAKAMSEDDLAVQVARACKTLKLRRYHTWRSIHSPAGFPDEVIVGPRGGLFRELKREGFDPTPAQQEWLDAMRAIGWDVGVWKPTDWVSGRITKELLAVAAPGARQ